MNIPRALLRALAAASLLTLALRALAPGAFAQSPALAIPAALDPSSFDRTCAPCDDFFTYANGGFLKRHPIPAAFASWGITDLISEDNRAVLGRILTRAADDRNAAPGSSEQKIGAYYRSCMDVPAIEAAGVEPLRTRLNAIDDITDRTSLAQVAAELARDGVEAGWSLDSEPDAKDSSRTIAVLGPSDLGMPDRDYYLLGDGRSGAIRNAYLRYVQTLLAAAGRDPAGAAADAAAIVALETVLAKATPPRADLRDPYATYHPMARARLQQLAPSIDWQAFAREAGAPPFDALDVALPDYVRTLDGMLARTPLETWKAYLAFRLLSRYARTLPRALADTRFAFYDRTLNGVTAQQPRPRQCVVAVDRALGEALGAVYVAQNFSPAAKARAVAMVDNLQSALREKIAAVDWMSPATKARAQRKLAAFVKKIGYPDHPRSYASLNVVDGPYVVNALAAVRFERDRELAKIGKPTDRSEWGMTAPTNNAYYDPTNNEIVFPAGILRPPYFSPAYDDALNYGAIGATIGHEMTHGFDDEGRQYDGNGNLVNWWTPADASRFAEHAACIVHQFDAYRVAPGVHENGRLVQGEAIADLGGVLIAYRAFQRTAEYRAHRSIGGFTPEQRFFIAYANSWAEARRDAFARAMAKQDPHPDERFRVNGTLADVPAFRAAFACPANAKMVRAHPCVVW